MHAKFRCFSAGRSSFIQDVTVNCSKHHNAKARTRLLPICIDLLEQRFNHCQSRRGSQHGLNLTSTRFNNLILEHDRAFFFLGGGGRFGDYGILRHSFVAHQLGTHSKLHCRYIVYV